MTVWQGVQPVPGPTRPLASSSSGISLRMNGGSSAWTSAFHCPRGTTAMASAARAAGWWRLSGPGREITVFFGGRTRQARRVVESAAGGVGRRRAEFIDYGGRGGGFSTSVRTTAAIAAPPCLTEPIMTANLQVAPAQLNLVVGDIDGNADKVVRACAEARDVHGADVVVFPELTITGYPPED